MQPHRVLVGLLLVVPAAGALLVSQVWPTLRTFWWSLRERGPTPGGGLAGLDHYDAARESILNWGSLLPLAAVLALLMVVVGPLLGYAAHRAGRAGRWPARLALTVPMVCFTPVALAAATMFDYGLVGDLGESVLRPVLWLAAAGLVCALSVTGYLAVYRGGHGWSAWPAGIALGVVGVLATVAVVVQAIAFPSLATTDKPADTIRRSLQMFDLGPAMAQATVLLGALMLLGTAATALVVATGMRITVAPEPAPATGRAVAGIATGVGLAAVLAGWAFGVLPWLRRLGGLDAGPESAATVLVNTWLPPLISTVVGVGLAAVAGFGIGALRPLGRWSELLLLPFAPWLFVGTEALQPARVVRDGFADSFAGLIPRMWLVVPALFLFTLLFRGLAADGHRYRPMLLWALPMVALTGGATWLVQSQTTGVASSLVTAPQLATTQAVRASDVGFGLVLPIPVILVFAAALAVLHLTYLDRLAIRLGL